MFDDKINKILGTGTMVKNPLKAEHTRTNLNVNPSDIVQKIRYVLDRCPEVKKAQGNIVIEAEDGKKSVVNLQYKS